MDLRSFRLRVCNSLKYDANRVRRALLNHVVCSCSEQTLNLSYLFVTRTLSSFFKTDVVLQWLMYFRMKNITGQNMNNDKFRCRVSFV